MITIRIDRKTGEYAIVDSYPAEGDDPWEAVAKVIADFAIKHGFVKYGNADQQLINEKEQFVPTPIKQKGVTS